MNIQPGQIARAWYRGRWHTVIIERLVRSRKAPVQARIAYIGKRIRIERKSVREV